MAGNTSTLKHYKGNREQPVHSSEAPKTAKLPVKPGVYEGQLSSPGVEKYSNPMNMGAPAKLSGIEGLYNDIGEMSGFVTEGYLDKNGTPYGEAAKFNFLPPGMDISNQENCDIRQMPLRKLVAESYPGDGWMPAPRDIVE